MIDKSEVIADILTAKNGDIVTITNDLKVVVIRDISLAERFTNLEKLIVDTHKKPQYEFKISDDQARELRREEDPFKLDTEGFLKQKKSESNEKPHIKVVKRASDIEVKNGDSISLNLASGEIKKVKKWSKRYDACIICGKSDRQHMGKGKCAWCYFLSPEDIANGKQYNAPAHKSKKTESLTGVVEKTIKAAKTLKETNMIPAHTTPEEDAAAWAAEVDDQVGEDVDETGYFGKSTMAEAVEEAKRAESASTEKKANPAYAGTMIVDKDRSYCQYSGCKHKNVLYNKVTMFDYEYMGKRFYFCSKPCKNEFISSHGLQ